MIANGVQISGVTQKRQTAGYQASLLSGGSHALFYDDGWDKRFTWHDVPKMKRDPMVLMGLRILEAPMHGVKLVANANSPQVEAFVEKTVTRVWQRALRKIIKQNEFGHMAGETEYKVERNRYRFHQLHAVAPLDAKPLRDVDSREIVGVRIRSIVGKAKGEVDLAMPNAFWSANEAEYGQPYGVSRLMGAREPWMEKAGRHGANEIRRLWFVKNAFHSGIIRYPIGTTLLPNGEAIDNQDLARQILQNLETGGILVLPNTRSGADGTGDFEWYWEPPAAAKDVANILEYPDKLDELILIGMGIPPEVMEAGVKGSWSGRATTMQMFFSSLDLVATGILDVITRLILKPLVLINFGRKAEFEVLHESLAEQAGKEPETVTERVQGKDTGGSIGPDPMQDVVGAVRGKPPVKRMSLNSIIEENPELYSSIREFSRGLWPTGGETRLSIDEHGREHKPAGSPEGGQFTGHKEPHVEELREKVTKKHATHPQDDLSPEDFVSNLKDFFETVKNPIVTSEHIDEQVLKLSAHPKSVAVAASEAVGMVGMKAKSKGEIIEAIRQRMHLRKGTTTRVKLIDRPTHLEETSPPVTHGDDIPIKLEVAATPRTEIDDHADTIRALYERSGKDLTIPMLEIDDTLAPLADMSKKELLVVAKRMELRGFEHKTRAVTEAAIRQKILDRRSSAQRENMITSAFGEPERLSVVTGKTEDDLYKEYTAALEAML